MDKGVPSLRKALRVLALLSDGIERGLSEISRQLGISKSTLHEILYTLEVEGFVRRNPSSKRYSLGPALFELLGKGVSESEMRKTAYPFMVKLREVSGETVFFGVVREEKVIVLEVVESDKDLRVTAPVGARVPLLAGALGKAYLARLEEEEVRKILMERGMKKYTSRTITDIDEYLEELKKVRHEGVALDDEEYLDGVRAIASLIDSPLLPLSAIWIVGFSSTFTYDRIRQTIPCLKEATTKIAKTLTNSA